MSSLNIYIYFLFSIIWYGFLALHVCSSRLNLSARCTIKSRTTWCTGKAIPNRISKTNILTKGKKKNLAESGFEVPGAKPDWLENVFVNSQIQYMSLLGEKIRISQSHTAKQNQNKNYQEPNHNVSSRMTSWSPFLNKVIVKKERRPEYAANMGILKNILNSFKGGHTEGTKRMW